MKFPLPAAAATPGAAQAQTPAETRHPAPGRAASSPRGLASLFPASPIPRSRLAGASAPLPSFQAGGCAMSLN